MDDQQQGVIAFRLDQMESSITDMNGKLDTLINQQATYNVQVALVEQKHEQLEDRVHLLEKKVTHLQSTDTDIQINLAQKLGPGAIAGAGGAGIMIVLRFIMGL